jgi:hypothetical protein
MLDMVVTRQDMRDTLARLVDLFMNPVSLPALAAPEEPAEETATLDEPASVEEPAASESEPQRDAQPA